MIEDIKLVGCVMYEIYGYIFKIIIDNVLKCNFFSLEMMCELFDVFILFDWIEDFWVGVLCVEGDYFIVGFDMFKFFGFGVKNEFLFEDNIDLFGLCNCCCKFIVIVV